MSKRKVKDPVTKNKSELVTTISKSEANSKSNQKYFKRNYLDVLKIITPNVYFEDDIDLSGTEVPPTSQVINSHVIAADFGVGTPNQILSVSSLSTEADLSALDTFSGISKYFVKQNKLTWITSKDFELNILKKLGKSYSNFDSSADFITYLSGTLLPTIVLQRANSDSENDLADNTASAFDNTSSGTHKYLIDNLSWLYFLNTSDPAQANVRPGLYATSAELAKMMTSVLWEGNVVTTKDALKIFQKYLWGNYSSLSSTHRGVLPLKYRASGADQYTSGVKHRDRLETLVDTIYSDHYFDKSDTKVKTSFEDYISTTSLITDTESAGPLSRLLEAFGFSLADRGTEIQELETLVDIDSCPDAYLPYLADLIGWTLVGPDASRHRNQLRKAVSIYKAKGTKRSIQAMTDSVFGGTSAFNITSGSLFDLWESYIPNIVYYTLTTSSTLTKDGIKSFSKNTATNLGIDTYSPTNLETNVRLAVDRIMWELINEFPNNFIFAGKTFPRVKFFLEEYPETEYVGDWIRDSDGNYYTRGAIVAGSLLGKRIIPKQNPDFVFKYRDRVMPIPPWESIKYYRNCSVSLALLNSLKKKLTCFGVDESAAEQVIIYIKENTIENSNISFYSNSFLFFTSSEKVPFNYEKVVNIVRPRGDTLLKYLPYWSGKSSHFKITFSSSSFDFTSETLDQYSKYALSRIKDIVDTVAPAHAIPDIILDVSSVEDTRLDLSAITAQKVDLDLSSVAASGASATIITNFAVSTVNPRNTSVLAESLQTVFRRESANSLNDGLFASGVADVFFSAAPRNAMRRKNYKYLMDDETINLRDGRGSAGYHWLYRRKQLPSFYEDNANKFATSGMFSLGYIPSTMAFAPVALVRDPNNRGNLIDRVTLDPVWYSCQTIDNVSDVFYEVRTSSTFPLRGLSAVDSSSVSSFFDRRGDLTKLQVLQHKVEEKSFLHEASSLVSGLYNEDGSNNLQWPVSSTKVLPTTLSSWYDDPSIDVVRSMANQLHETTISRTDTNYMRDFAFGPNLHRLYKVWLDNYTKVGAPEVINLNSKYIRPDEILSHTFGPYIFNPDFEITASSIDDVAPQLITSALESPMDIGWNFGVGVLAENNSFGVSSIAASDASSMYVGQWERRSDTLLSGVEFVDTSNPFIPSYGTNSLVLPTFNLIRLTKQSFETGLPPDVPGSAGSFTQFTGGSPTMPARIPKWMQTSRVEDNLLIKYRRANSNSFSRLRYKIEPDGRRPDIKNFFTPDCDYVLEIEAANIKNFGYLGGGTIKAWIHTEPIPYTYSLPDGSYTTEDSIWSYSNGLWVRTKLSDINSNGIDIVKGLSPGVKFGERPVTTRSSGAESSRDRSIVDNEVINPYNNLNPRVGCVEEIDTELAQASYSAELFETLTINFDTKNKNVKEVLIDKIHTKNRKYYVEIFISDADLQSYVLFDKINMYNKTFKDRAHVPTRYNRCELNRKELKTCFDYFTSLTTSRLASRNAYTTSGNMELSGGSRLSYRDNINREVYSVSGDGSFGQVTSLIIRGN